MAGMMIGVLLGFCLAFWVLFIGDVLSGKVKANTAPMPPVDEIRVTGDEEFDEIMERLFIVADTIGNLDRHTSFGLIPYQLGQLGKDELVEEANVVVNDLYAALVNADDLLIKAGVKDGIVF